MKNKFVKLGLAHRSIESLMVLGNSVVTSMDGNPAFPDPPVDLGDLLDELENLATTHQRAVQFRSLADYAQERFYRLNVESLLRALGNYVNSVAYNDENKILSAGMPVSKNPEQAQVPAQIAAFLATFTNIQGSIQLAWKRPKFATQFKVYMSTNPGDSGSWELINTITARKLMVENLASGQRFYFKVEPVGKAGAGPVSEIADALAA